MLEAAIAEFQRSGYDGASMDAIATAAGVSKRTLYNHFTSKEALFRSLAEEMIRRITDYSSLQYRRDVPLRDQLLRYARDSAALSRDEEAVGIVRAVLSEQMRSLELFEGVIEEYWRKEYGFADWVEAACADGRLRAVSPERSSHIFAALIKTITVWPVVFRRIPQPPDELDATIEEAVDMFLAYHAP
jgi:TetR/AcrR family transcriptional regulator of autoinduction and epiphytic fitness